MIVQHYSQEMINLHKTLESEGLPLENPESKE